MRNGLVFTNGVFDVIHAGHVRLLQYARTFGHGLIVGINSDESAKRLKGPTRPIFNQEDRATILNALSCVDDVRIFNEDTPETLIRNLRPMVLVKGPEAFNAEIPGAEFVKAIGGRVVVPDWTVDVSTSLIVNKILGQQFSLPTKCEIIIGNRKPPMETLSLMFNKQPDGMRPVLYENGKRVIDCYKIEIQYQKTLDVQGCSA